ncbi:DinI-like family protein [Erwinia papayae]|uniref:DinI-like family protein n=1 Tax=Erwinia papayae TaxID=206499 RepID=A0ABV3N391_9GAMM
MYVELIYDKRNVDGLPNARQLILTELEKRVHRIFPSAEVRVKPMMGNSSINTDANKGEKEKLNRLLEEMFEEADMWLVNEV